MLNISLKNFKGILVRGSSSKLVVVIKHFPLFSLSLTLDSKLCEDEQREQPRKFWVQCNTNTRENYWVFEQRCAKKGLCGESQRSCVGCGLGDILVIKNLTFIKHFVQSQRGRFWSFLLCCIWNLITLTFQSSNACPFECFSCCCLGRVVMSSYNVYPVKSFL